MENSSEILTLNLILNDLVTSSAFIEIVNDCKNIVTLKRSHILKHLLFSLLKRPISYHNKILSRIIDIRHDFKSQVNKTPGKPTFLLRVDDFPRWDKSSDQFLSFHKILCPLG